MVELVEVILRPSRTRSVELGVATLFLMSLVGALYQQADLSRGESWWGEGTALDLLPIKGKVRSRRVSSAFKEAVVQAVYDDAELGSVRSYLAVTKKSSGFDVATPTVYCTSNSSKITTETMFRYWHNQVETLKNTEAQHYSIDGLCVGGDETEVLIAFDPVLMQAAVPPPQVQRAKIVLARNDRGPLVFCNTSR